MVLKEMRHLTQKILTPPPASNTQAVSITGDIVGNLRKMILMSQVAKLWKTKIINIDRLKIEIVNVDL